MSSTSLINILSLPESDCCNYPVNDELGSKVIVHLTQECDSLIDLVINEKNVLNGYDGAFAYPTFMFMKGMSQGLSELRQNGVATVPIYLQQYSFGEDSPQHSLNLCVDRDDDAIARVSFSWCPFLLRPKAVPSVENERVSIRDYAAQIVKCMNTYKNAVTAIAADLPRNIQDEIREQVLEPLHRVR